MPIDEQLEAKLREGFVLHQKGQLQEAQKIYRQVLDVQPKHFDALHLLGVIAQQTNNHRMAVDLIGKAIESFPGNADARYNRGIALANLEQYQSAIDSYDEAILLKPDHAG